eukprot:3339180-Prymnesium_polylepis.1
MLDFLLPWRTAMWQPSREVRAASLHPRACAPVDQQRASDAAGALHALASLNPVTMEYVPSGAVPAALVTLLECI